MLTLQGLAPSIPVLVGDLRQHRRGPIPGRPYQMIEAWCPACRDMHSLSLPDVFPIDGVELVDAPCNRGPWAGQRIAVGLDPGRRAEHRRVAADFAARLRRWRVEQGLRHQLAAERKLDRVHHREWGGM